ncbi:MAG: PKD domain-containing protein, partial [Acaryochloridaceae cyanobacterium RL_2_7]|nr:PKD domain-containing protein [Acaryochloridaceae cyanobacterium RL_2_7]
GLSFDAGGSYDPDVPESNGEAMLAIASYAWDFDGDGDYDDFGRNVSHKFDSAGEKQVSLTVWDTEGATDTLTATINVTESWFVDRIQDGSFSESTPETTTERSKYQSSMGIGLGWLSNGWTIDNTLGDGGAAIAVDPVRALGQVVYDDFLRTGQQTLTMDITNVEGDSQSNQITTRIWGINGQFRQRGWSATGPEAQGVIPMESTLLLEETVGGVDFDWTTFQWNADFQDGFQYLVIQVDADGFDNTTSDFIAVDNVRLDYDGTDPVVPDLPNGDSADRDAGDAGSPEPEQPELPTEDQTLTGTMGRDTIYGGLGNDDITARGHHDYIEAYAGDDKLRGGGGHDTIWGGAGNDTLLGSNGSDSLIGGADNDFLLGGNGDDILRGGDGMDQLLGGKGADTLEGGLGQDRFRWTRDTDFGDVIIDFDGREDRLQFKASALNSDLEKGFITDTQLVYGTFALGAEDRFIYNTINGNLSFDADGNGAGQKVLVAKFVNIADLTASHIQII